MKFATFILALFSLAQAHAETCPELRFKYCYGRDTISGAYLYEYEVKDCKVFETRLYQTDYKCTEQGTLKKTDSLLIDGKWVSKTNTTPRSSDVMEYGTVKENYRLFWNPERTRLIQETEVEKNMMVQRLFSKPRTFRLAESVRKTVKSMVKEGKEVVIRSTSVEKRKSEVTRNEWLTESKDTIETFDLL